MKLVTGGLGFIGNELVRQLLSTTEVSVIDNQNRVAPLIQDLNSVPVFNLNIVDHSAVSSAMAKCKPDTVFHLAAIHYIPECNANPELAMRINVEGTLSVLRAAAINGVKHFVFASSGAVYGDSPVPLSEGAEIAPVDIYGWTKWFGEDMCRWYAKNTNMRISICRLFNNYGPRETNAHILPEIISQLRKSSTLKLGNIQPRRDYIYTSDTARSMILLDNLQHSGLVTVNIASGHHASVAELINRMKFILDRDINIETDLGRFRKADKLVQVADISYLKKLVNWSPEVDLDSGLKSLLKFERLLD